MQDFDAEAKMQFELDDETGAIGIGMEDTGCHNEVLLRGNPQVSAASGALACLVKCDQHLPGHCSAHVAVGMEQEGAVPCRELQVLPAL